MVSNKYRKKAEIYKLFVEDKEKYDFSEEALQEMYEYESQGKGDCGKKDIFSTDKKWNGYAFGKKWLNVAVAQWMERLRHPEHKYSNLKPREGWYNVLKDLYSDEFPWWWLDEVFKSFLEDKEAVYKLVFGKDYPDLPSKIMKELKKELACQR